jgi:hypothetical protein
MMNDFLEFLKKILEAFKNIFTKKINGWLIVDVT